MRRIALALPDTAEDSSRGMSGWSVHQKAFAWERPLRRGDLEALGDDARAPKRLANKYLDARG